MRTALAVGAIVLLVACSDGGADDGRTTEGGSTTTTIAGSITPGEVNGDITSPRVAAALATLVVDGVVNDDDSVTVIRLLRGAANVGDRVPIRHPDDPLLTPGSHAYMFIDTSGGVGEVTFFTSSERVALRLAAGMEQADRMSDDQLGSLVRDPAVRLIASGRIVPDAEDPLRATLEVDVVLRADEPVTEGSRIPVFRDEPVDDRPGGPWVFEVAEGSWNTGVRGVLFLGAASAEGRPVLNPTEPWLVDADMVIEALNG